VLLIIFMVMRVCIGQASAMKTDRQALVLNVLVSESGFAFERLTGCYADSP
jgi:hypothetical protein